MEILAVDITPNEIRGCITDTESGECLSEIKVISPLEDTTPHKVLAQIHKMVSKWYQWEGPVGCAFPAPIQNGYILPGGKVHQSWVDANAEQLFSDITDNPFHVINDTDAAGIAEMSFGAGRGETGVAIKLSLDTFFGSSLFTSGKLVPNTEMGRMIIGNEKIEDRLAVIVSNNLSKEKKADHIQEVLEHLENIFHPNLFILGGALGNKADKIFPYIKINTPFKAEELESRSRITGAAIFAATRSE